MLWSLAGVLVVSQQLPQKFGKHGRFGHGKIFCPAAFARVVLAGKLADAALLAWGEPHGHSAFVRSV